MISDDIKKDFPIFQDNDISYLDSAATTHKPQYVIDAISNFYKNYNSNPHRGAYSLSIKATEIYENTREKVASFINAKQSEEIVFTKNATEALNLIAYSYGMNKLKKGDEIVISIMEHHSNLVPWQKVAKVTGAKLKYLYINDNFQIDEEEIMNKITNKTKIVAITHMSNVTGTINDICKISQYAHKKGAITVIDVSQSIAHIKIDVQKINADFLAFSGHKMFAPLGIGVLYGKKELLEKMTPFLMGGDMIEYVYEQETVFASLPNKFEAGTQNIAGVIGLGAAIKYIEKIGYDNIQKAERKIISYAVEELSKLDFLELYIPRHNHSSVISFNIKGVHPHDVASILDSIGVCIRAGNHCAQPLMRYLKIDSTCRVSISVYTTKGDVDRLISGIKKAHEMFKKYIK